MKRIDISGQRFGRLIILSYSHTKNRSAFWKCICDCGVISIKMGDLLRNGKCKSCGCIRMENLSKIGTTHGKTGKSEYASWSSMKQRCYNKYNKKYNYYGGRGITVSLEWRNSFSQFYKDMGPKPSMAHTLDRIENDKGYCKSNCRWATPLEQSLNKRNNIRISFNNQTMTISQWSQQLGISESVIKKRLVLGYSNEHILSKTNIHSVRNRASDRMIKYKSKIQSVTQWAKELGIKRNTISARLFRGYSVEKAFSQSDFYGRKSRDYHTKK
jgi:hypothetical protein